MKFKKAISFFLTMALFITSLVCFGVTASAESIANTAKYKKSGDAFTVKLNDSDYRTKNHDYKIQMAESGDLKVFLNAPVESIYVEVYDANGESIYASNNESKASVGSIVKSFYGNLYAKWNSTLEQFKGTFVFKSLDKGTYYIRIYKATLSTFSGMGKATVKFTYPQGDDPDTKITGLQLTLKKGNEAALSALMSGSGSVTWSSSKKEVATVSKSGKVKAVGKGTAVITAKCGNTSAAITIKVE